MNMNEAMSKVLAIFPDAIFDEGADGELLISTGFYGEERLP